MSALLIEIFNFLSQNLKYIFWIFSCIHFTNFLGEGSSRESSVNTLWSLDKWCNVYEKAIQELAKRFDESVKENRVLTWDKDDEPSMNFVAACANIRSHIFHIPEKSLFDVKSMAGNIVPAIATTNACVAGTKKPNF